MSNIVDDASRQRKYRERMAYMAGVWQTSRESGISREPVWFSDQCLKFARWTKVQGAVTYQEMRAAVAAMFSFGCNALEGIRAWFSSWAGKVWYSGIFWSSSRKTILVLCQTKTVLNIINYTLFRNLTDQLRSPSLGSIIFPAQNNLTYFIIIYG